MNNQKLTTSEKIQELKMWILNSEGLYHHANVAKGYIESYEPNQEELINGLNSFMFEAAKEANIFIKPSEIDTIRESIYSIIMRID